MRVQISCINKPDRYSSHEAITAVGGFHNGKRWKLSQKDAIAGIENGTYQFFVNEDGTEADVIVETDRFGHKYIRTKPDATTKNNLLNLTTCPL